jgi:hypothetical protein
MRDTWYVLEDGRTVCPSEVAYSDGGRLQHKSGTLVAMRGDVPSTSGVDLEEERAKALASGAKTPNAARAEVGLKEIKPEQSTAGYKTRETKAR